MFKKVLLSIGFIFVVSSFSQVRATNWFGTGDTAIVHGFNGTDTIYTKAFNLTDFEDLRAILKINDSSSSGFKNDSVHAQWGFQNGSIILNSNYTVDTVWNSRIVIDTCKSDSFGVKHLGRMDATGTITRTLNMVDTSSITGWAVQDRWIVPEWSVLYRMWIEGMAGNKTVIPLKAEFEINRRTGTRVQVKN
jgi:hypothetical protein